MNLFSEPASASIPNSADQIKQTVREFLTAHLNVNDWYLGAHITRIGETLARSAPYIHSGDRVLEAGSYGHIPLLLWRLFGSTSVYAYNLQASYIGYGQGALRSEGDPQTEFQCHIEAVNIEQDRWPRLDGSLDVVLCFEVLEHLREHPMFMMAEANRVLKDGGYFILTSPNSSSYHALINILYRENPFIYSVYGSQRDGMGHIKEYAVNELQLLFKNSGFEVVTHTTFSPYQDEKDALFPELRAQLNRYGLVNEMSGSTHFLVARKISRPSFEYYRPLYEITRAWSPSVSSGSISSNIDLRANGVLSDKTSQTAPLFNLNQSDQVPSPSEDIIASILVPVQGEWEDLPPCVEALFDVRVLMPNVEIVFIPHLLGLHQILRLNEISQLRRNTRVAMSDPSITRSQALNQAAQSAGGRWLIFLDSNCRPKPGWLPELLKAAGQEGTGMLSAKTLYPPDESINIERIYDCGVAFDAHQRPRLLYQYCLAAQPFTNHPRQLQAVSGRLMLIGKELFETFGGFDVSLSGQQAIFDLGFRLRQYGLIIRLAPACEVYLSATVTLPDPDFVLSDDSAFISKWSSSIFSDEIDHYHSDGLALGPDGSMHIAMLAPLAPKKTGVADYVQELIPSLSQFVTLDLFVDGYIPTDASLLRQHCVRLISDLESCHHAQPYDQIVYHIGNNSFHTAIYEAAARLGGIMVVHEYDSKGCLAGSAYLRPTNLEEIRPDFDELVYLSNNPDVAAAVQKREFSSGWEHFVKYGYHENRIYTRKKQAITTNKALWQNLFKRAAGIIVHNHHSQALFKAEFPALPVAVIPHLLSPKALLGCCGDMSEARRRLGLPQQTFVIVSMGLIQPHKRNHITLQAFAQFVRQYPNSLLVLGGEAIDENYCAYLENLIKKLGLQDRVRLTGWIPDEAFFDWISAGDVMVNLRYPSRGEESGTLIRILGSGKPAFVSDYAQYANIPDECVIKIPFVDEVKKLSLALNRLAGNEPLRHQLAENARLYFRDHNAVEQVAQEYAAFCKKVQEKPWGRTFDYSTAIRASVLWEMSCWKVDDPSRDLALALDRIGVPIHVKALAPFRNSLGLNVLEAGRLRNLETLPLADRFIQVYCGPVESFRRHSGAAYAIVMTDHFDKTGTKINAAPLDEIWVPSTHSRQQLISQGLPAEKIAVVPFGVSALAYGATIHQPRLEGPFTFLTIMDWSERTGWEDVLTAFLQEFKGRRDVRLSLRLLPDGATTHGRKEALQHLARFARRHHELRKGLYKQVNLESQLIEQDEIPLLYTLADGYILPYLDSAFGRTLLEAMAVGLPVITSNNGGQCDYTNDSNAFLVAVESQQGQPIIDNRALRAHMRQVVDNRLESQARGICARNTVLTSWTWENAADCALQRLQAAYGASLIRPKVLPEILSPNLTKIDSAESRLPEQALGFNVIGYISGNLGLGVTARNVIRVLLDKGCSVNLLDLDPGIGRTGHDLSFKSYMVSSPEKLSHFINLFVLPPSDLVGLLQKNKGHWLSREHLNVAWSMWELPLMPPTWCEQMQAMDVLIAESHFIRQTFNSSLSGIQTLLAVHPLYLPDGIISQRTRFGLPEDGLLFITSFEPYSDVQRKNPLAVLQAFQRAFDQDAPVHLVIKINNPTCGDQLHPFVQELQQRCAGNQHIHILAETLSYPDVLNLYASCDVYISLHRSEGLGLGLMEAMMLGKPVIATAWSGNMTYMNSTNSCPVSYHLIPIDGSIPAYRENIPGQGAAWADPDLDDAVAWMRRLADDPDLRARIGRQAAFDMQQWQSEAQAAKFIDELREIIENRALQRQELALHHQWVGWKVEGSQLFTNAHKKRSVWQQKAFQRYKLAVERRWTGRRAVAKRVLRIAQKTGIGRWLILRLYNRKIIHSLHF